MHKKLINDLHNIAFGIVSSVGNYYSNVEKIHRGNLYLLPKHKNHGKGKRKGGKNVQKGASPSKPQLWSQSCTSPPNRGERTWSQGFETVLDLQAERVQGEAFCPLSAPGQNESRSPLPATLLHLQGWSLLGHWELWPKPSPSISATKRLT